MTTTAHSALSLEVVRLIEAVLRDAENTLLDDLLEPEGGLRPITAALEDGAYLARLQGRGVLPADDEAATAIVEAAYAALDEAAYAALFVDVLSAIGRWVDVDLQPQALDDAVRAWRCRAVDVREEVHPSSEEWTFWDGSRAVVSWGAPRLAVLALDARGEEAGRF